MQLHLWDIISSIYTGIILIFRFFLKFVAVLETRESANTCSGWQVTVYSTLSLLTVELPVVIADDRLRDIQHTEESDGTNLYLELVIG